MRTSPRVKSSSSSCAKPRDLKNFKTWVGTTCDRRARDRASSRGDRGDPSRRITRRAAEQTDQTRVKRLECDKRRPSACAGARSVDDCGDRSARAVHALRSGPPPGFVVASRNRCRAVQAARTAARTCCATCSQCIKLRWDHGRITLRIPTRLYVTRVATMARHPTRSKRVLSSSDGLDASAEVSGIGWPLPRMVEGTAQDQLVSSEDPRLGVPRVVATRARDPND